MGNKQILNLLNQRRLNMSISLLYHTNQITNIQEKKTEYSTDKVVFHVQYIPKEESCPCCGSKEYSSKGVKIRKLKLPPVGDKLAFLSVSLNRLKCIDCDQIWWPTLPFTRAKKRFTKSFERFVIELMKFATIEHVAKFLRVSWSLIKNIHKAYLIREYQKPDLKSIQYIGIDEFSITKGHKYMTIFINLQSGEIIHAVEGKSMDSVAPFLLKLKEEASQLKAVAIDMNAAYASAVKKYLPVEGGSTARVALYKNDKGTYSFPIQKNSTNKFDMSYIGLFNNVYIKR